MKFMKRALLSLVIASSLSACGGGSGNEKSSEQAEVKANSLPVADAGSDLEGLVGSEVTLDGSASSDADGDALSYTWKLINGPYTDIALTNSSTLSFTPKEAGQFEFSLTVSDGKETGSTDNVFVNVTAINSTPEASILAEQSLQLGQQAFLSATGSSDQDGDELSYKWQFLSVPSGSQITSSNLSQQAEVSFNPDIAGEYIIELKVSDQESTSEAVTVKVNVLPNEKPDVNITTSPDNLVGQETYLYSSVTDVDSNEFSYIWEITSVPEGSKLLGFTFSKAFLAFTPDLAGQYEASLTINDGFNSVINENLEMTVVSQKPISYKIGGEAQYTGIVNEPVLLDFADSISPNGKKLSFTHTVRSGPRGSRPSLSRSLIDQAETEFKSNLPGKYRIFVTMEDDEGYGAVKSIDVTLFSDVQEFAPNSIIQHPHMVKLGDSINFDGSASFTLNNEILSYEWSVLDKPLSADLSIESANAVQQTLTPKLPGIYKLSLLNKGLDTQLSSSTEAIFNVYDNQAAIKAITQGVAYAKQGDEITLDGSLSFGIHEDITAYWDVIAAPYNSTSVITNANSLTPKFTLDTKGKFVFQLRLKNGENLMSVAHLVVHSKENALPIANAGEDIDAVSGESITLDGTSSFDKESTALTYEWSLIGMGNADFLSSSDIITNNYDGTAKLNIPTSFTGQLVVALTVSDGENKSLRDEVVINVNVPEVSSRLEKFNFITLVWEELGLSHEGSVSVKPVSETSGSGVQFLGMYQLYAENGSLTLTDIQIRDLNNVIEPTLKIVDYNYSLSAEQQVDLDYSKNIVVGKGDSVTISVISPANTNGKAANVELMFKIVETEEVFKTNFEYKN